MLRIWAAIAGLFLLASLFGQPMPAVGVSGPVGVAAAGTGGCSQAGSGTGAAPQVMQVYVMSDGAPSSGGGNVTAAASGMESQGTAFYLEAGGRRVVVAPYHAWAMAGAGVKSGEVYLAGQSGGQWWTDQARVLGADQADDVVFLAVPAELKNVQPLKAAGTLAVGNELHGAGWASGVTVPNQFNGAITYYGSETETAGSGAGSWQLTFQGYGVHGSGVKPGDSGTPALTADGRVAGEVVAAGSGWILVVPSTAIQQAMGRLAA